MIGPHLKEEKNMFRAQFVKKLVYDVFCLFVCLFFFLLEACEKVVSGYNFADGQKHV